MPAALAVFQTVLPLLLKVLSSLDADHAAVPHAVSAIETLVSAVVPAPHK